MLPALEKYYNQKDNGPEATKLLLDLLNVKISWSTLKKEIEEHPDFLSLASISDVLNGYGVENLTASFEQDKFVNIPPPFITQIKGIINKIDFFTVVKEINENTIHFFDPEKHKWSFTSKEEFLKRWSRLVLLTEVRDNAGEEEYDKKIIEEKRRRGANHLSIVGIPVIMMFAGVLAFIHHGTSALFPFIFSILTLSGSIIGVLLLWHELDRYNPMLHQICSVGKKANCDAILQSRGARIMGISWSVIGSTYFMGELLLFLISGITNGHALFVLTWINALSIPYVFFSIYYQWRVVKQWCVLCLGIQGILLLQFAAALMDHWHTLLPVTELTPELLLQTIASFVVPAITIALLMPALHEAKENSRNRKQLQRLKHNPQIFEALLSKQKAVTESTKGLGITLGASNAPHKIIKVCNPYCGPCARAHRPLEELLYNNSAIQVQILYTATNKDGDLKTNPVKHLLAIAETSNEKLIKQALDDWYLSESKDYLQFAAKYPITEELAKQGEKIDAMEKWCSKTGISFTPTFFVNGYQLPELYNIHDLKYFLSV